MAFLSGVVAGTAEGADVLPLAAGRRAAAIHVEGVADLDVIRSCPDTASVALHEGGGSGRAGSGEMIGFTANEAAADVLKGPFSRSTRRRHGASGSLGSFAQTIAT